MAFKLSRSSLNNLSGVDNRLVDVIYKALKISKIDFGIPVDGGFRTTEMQQHLFNIGASQLDGVNKKSRHQTGKAFDVFAYVDGRASWNREHLLEVATAILAAASQIGVKLEWGGHWATFEDMPHFQLVE